ncbi:MAG TPA: PKD domain-containing protein, partial [Gemmatimonadales bacterium]|nr:PKD domain-containing protein [Gemmatimonadales bacterium]
TALATVGATTGVVTGVAAGGPVTITATSEGQSGISAVTVTLVPVATVDVTPNPGSVNVGATLPLTATLKDAIGNTLTGRDVTWSSNNTTLATVDAAGVVTGVAVGGPVTITATSEGQSGTSAVTVTGTQVPVAAVDVTPATAAIAWGSTRQFTATPKDAAGNPLTGRAVTWASSAPAMASVSPTGFVGGVAPGAATITATIEGIVGTASVTVSDFVLMVGAGDISECSNNNDEATAVLLDGYAGDPVFTVGDNVYENGTTTEFNNCYNPTWGRHKARTFPVAGNHDYNTSNATGYYNYFGAAAGDPTKGYYSFDQGAWHIVVLNSNVPRDVNSPQLVWLRADLAASAKQCQLAIFHHPQWTNHPTRTNNDYNTRPFWDALWSAGVELVVNGHDHHYVRFAPQTPKGGLDPTGIRQITVGTGGAAPLYPFGPEGSNVEVRNNATFGVLELKLRSGTYDWRFVPVAGQTFTDAGTGACVGPRPPPPNQLPIAQPGGPYASEAVVAFDGRASDDPDGDTPLTYAWDFGDGTIGTGDRPTHTYAANGVYTVTLRVTDGLGGQSAPVTTTATIANVAPTVNAGPDAAIGLGVPFNLTAGISDPGLNDGPWTYVINWGDGSPNTSGSAASQGAAAISAAHVYTVAGQYSAVVTVTDKDGGIGSDAVSAQVTALPPSTIVHTLLTAGNGTANTKVYSTAAFAPSANALITVAVLGYRATETPPVPTLSGGGMTTWEMVSTVTFDGGTPLRRLTIFRAMSAQPGNGPLTITSSLTLSNMQWIVSQWDGVDVSGVNGAGAVVQAGSASGTGVNGLTVPLTAFAHPNNVAYGVFGVAKNATVVTPVAGFTEITEVPSVESPHNDLQAQRGTNLPTIGATWTNLAGGAIGIELKVRP